MKRLNDEQCPGGGSWNTRIAVILASLPLLEVHIFMPLAGILKPA
jgi:hypothetical protein